MGLVEVLVMPIPHTHSPEATLTPTGELGAGGQEAGNSARLGL